MSVSIFNALSAAIGQFQTYWSVQGESLLMDRLKLLNVPMHFLDDRGSSITNHFNLTNTFHLERKTQNNSLATQWLLPEGNTVKCAQTGFSHISLSA